MLKRALDIIACLAIAPLALPLLACLAVWIKADSSGPVLFKQTRIGRNRAPFQIYKLRTMTDRPADAINQVDETVLAAKTDRRVTRAGRILRSLSLDELPQLWNILNGDMSLVGPRPVLPEQLKAIPDEMMTRFAVRPGITGLAQVNGRRTLTWPQQLAWDTTYARSAGLLLDLKILAKTVIVVLAREGIYGGDAGNWRQYIRRDE